MKPLIVTTIMTTYKKLEAIILPQLKSFKEDLKVYDRKILSNYKGKFLYGIRENGTNLIKLDSKSLIKSHSTKVATTKELERSLYALKYSNKKFYYFDGENINEINWEQLHTIYGYHIKETHRLQDNIERLNIKELAYELNSLMNERNWKSILKTSECSAYRRIRNNFDFFKFKRVLNTSEVENMLLENCNMLN